MNNFGEALKYQREIFGLNQPELAEKVGTSQANISRWERSEVAPNIEFCLKLAHFYGISVEELLGIDLEDTVTIGAISSTKFSSEERRLIEDYRKLNASGKKLIDTTFKTLLATSGGSEQKTNRNI